MFYREFQPHPVLKKYIHCYWILENDCKPDAPEPQRILPDGRMELIFHFKDPVQRQTNGTGFELQAPATVSGQIKHFIQLQPTGTLGVLGVRFRPTGAVSFLRMPMSELTEKVHSLDLIWGKIGKELIEQVLSASSHRQRIQLVEKFLLKRIEQNPRNDALIQEAVKEIAGHDGAATVNFLMRKLKISGRHLERKFDEHVGLSPKRFSRIVRFQNIFRIVAEGAKVNLTAVAHRAGYYDQAHFIREFKELSGLRPSEYFSREHSLTDCFTGANEMSDLYKSIS